MAAAVDQDWLLLEHTWKFQKFRASEGLKVQGSPEPYAMTILQRDLEGPNGGGLRKSFIWGREY